MGGRTALLVLVALAGSIPLVPAQAEYPRLAIAFPEVKSDVGGLDAFLLDLQRAAEEKDLDGLEPHLSPEFFWDRDFRGGFNKSAAPVDNFALSLHDAALSPEYQGIGWRAFHQMPSENNRMAHPTRDGFVCLPGEPVFANPGLAKRTFEQTGTDQFFDWGYVEDSGIVVLEHPRSGAATLATLDQEAVRVREWLVGSQQAPWAEVETPEGVRGFLPQEQVGSWLPERLCFGRESEGAWKIAGFIGGGD